MSRIVEELQVIPRAAWYLAAGVYLALATLIFTFVMPTDPDFRDWPLWGKVLLPYGAVLLVFVYILLVSYVYADAKRRGMRYVLWTFIAVLVPQAIGIILYFILRDPLPVTCPSCHSSALKSHTFCPSCGTPLRPTCSQCGKATDIGWSHCPQCGGKLGAPAPHTA